MGFIYEERLSDSPYVETITHGRTEGEGSSLRPAETHWHMVFVRHNGKIQLMVVGPLTTSGIVSYTEGAEIIWIKFQLGTFMPHLPTRKLLDKQMSLPEASGRSFWLHGSTWQFPDYENVDTFIDRLVRNDVLVRDSVVNAVLQDHPQKMTSRTVRHHFLQSTGLTQSYIHQVERAKRAEELLLQGKSILDTVHEADYFDQPHLTRSMKQLIGQTPAQIVREYRAEKLAI